MRIMVNRVPYDKDMRSVVLNRFGQHQPTTLPSIESCGLWSRRFLTIETRDQEASFYHKAISNTRGRHENDLSRRSI